jgi:hypothetical protein
MEWHNINPRDFLALAHLIPDLKCGSKYIRRWNVKQPVSCVPLDIAWLSCKTSLRNYLKTL